ncbi:MAG: helix-turn-helix domain-containing protein [Candidatus Nanopelagicales bacterium]
MAAGPARPIHEAPPRTHRDLGSPRRRPGVAQRADRRHQRQRPAHPAPARLPRRVLERDLLTERTKAGLEAARKQGRVGGRPRALSPAAAEAATRMYRDEATVTHIAATLRVSRATIYRHIATLTGVPGNLT